MSTGWIYLISSLAGALFAMAVRRVVEAHDVQHPMDGDARRVARHEDHGLLVVCWCIRIGLAHHDQDLAARSRANLSHYPQVAVHRDNGCRLSLSGLDGLYVNAGATQPLDGWLDALGLGGRLILPLTCDDNHGVVFRIERASYVPLDTALPIARRSMAPRDLASVRRVRLEGSLVHRSGG